MTDKGKTAADEPAEPASDVADSEPKEGEVIAGHEVNVEDLPDLAIVAERHDAEPPVIEGKAEVEKRPKGQTIIIDEPPDAPAAVGEVQRKPKRGEKEIVYRGFADSYEFGEFRFRPGQPVIVPSDVAEELLTAPFETFEAFERSEEDEE